ncbi:MAG: hypothetical protein ACO1SV_14070 [Fimbriimonas sp.]
MLPATILLLAPPGPADRKAILDAFRPTVERALKGKRVKFVVRHLGIAQGWAFLDAEVVQPNGRPLSFKGTPLEEEAREGFLDDGAVALLRKEGKRWKVVDHALFPTDVPWEPWIKQYKAPRSVYPKFGG